MYVIQPKGGLCNYLRVVFSYYIKACELNEELVVIWNITSQCNGFFLDYFMPIKNITFKKENTDKLKINYYGCYPYNNYKINYSMLEPLPELKNLILSKIKVLNNNYNAIHVRRTDHTNLAKKKNKFTSNEMFFEFLDNIKDKNCIYIATDNEKTYNEFKDKYKDNIKFKYHNEINGLRKTSLKDAIIDLYMCIYANNFMGSQYSSFSDLITSIRKMDKK
jgi:hypothetical protein